MSPSQPEAFDPLVDQRPARYVVGIDLGTTNSAVMFVDTEAADWKIETLEIPQLVGPHEIEARDTLPSFHYQGAEGTTADGALKLAWHKKNPNWCVGTFARDEGQKSPGRLIASAKSWLCHSGVDRTAKLLPWQGAPDVARLSPVEASSRLLGHIRAAWDHRFPQEPLAEQDIVITLPASFDEVARELTIEAAAAAQLKRVFLIEEPQAAFYAWVYKHNNTWSDRVAPGETILVCDIGGGTSDFTLIHVRPADGGGQGAVFHRVAVGEHLILGGDNLDLTLAQHLEERVTGEGKLTPAQWDVLVRSCRRVKETLLGPEAPEQVTVHLPGSGAKLIGGGLQATASRAEVATLLVDGFLPRVSLDEQPQSGQSGFREFGLPYASDPAITRHLAAFLRAHGEAQAIRPDAVLFNGGFFASPPLREQLLGVLRSWFAGEDAWEPKILEHDRLDLAVARGAAYYGMVRRGEGVRISANLARSYYLLVDQDGASRCVCLVPGHATPGEAWELANLDLEVTISEPVEFSVVVSSTRLTDDVGAVVAFDREHMRPLPPIRTVLRTERKNQRGTLPISLHAQLSEIGTIELWCQSTTSDHRWRLQFDVRAATHTDQEEQDTRAAEQGVLDEAAWEACQAAISDVFGAGGEAKPAGLVKAMAAALSAERLDWPTSLLRRIWECLLELREGRRTSPAHEVRWLNLLGFALRPGYGLAVDDWRVSETWRHVRGKLVHAGSQAESLILWRRIAGGLSAGQQAALAEPLISALRSAHAQATGGKKSRGTPAVALHESSEAWRLLASLELLPLTRKLQVGQMLCELLPRRKYEKVANSMVWAMGRLGQRQPLYGPLNTVVPTQTAAEWIARLRDHELLESTHLALMQLARRTGDRHRDLDETQRDPLVRWMRETGAASHLVDLVQAGGQLDHGERDQVFGEALPKGIRLRAT